MVDTTFRLLSSGDTLYQQIGKYGQLLASDIPIYMYMGNCQYKLSENIEQRAT